MVERIAREIPLFESLGLFTEAPKKKRKPRVISVRPIAKDYTNSIDPDEDFDVDSIDDLGDDLSDYDSLDVDLGEDLGDFDEPAIDGDEDPEVDLGDDDTLADLGDDSLDVDDELDDLGTDIPDLNFDDLDEGEEQIDAPSDEETVEPTQDTTEEPEAPAEEVPEEQPEETTDEQPAEEQPPAEGDGEVIDATGGDPEAEGDLGAEVDIAPADGTDPNAQPMDTTTTTGGEVESITKDDMRKYELFKRFMNLYNTLRYFIDKLENGVTDDKKFEYASKKALTKFKSLEELTKDYMILKFQSDSFLQNSFFFEKIKASALLILELLNANKFNKEEK